MRLVDENGEQVGVIAIHEAKARAMDVGLDLVEVSPTAKPPVCKIMDYSKFKYQQAMRKKEARKKQTRIEVKEIKFRPGTDTHDFDFKMKNIQKFLNNGDKVKCTIRFRGREMAHQNLGLKLLQRVEEILGDTVKIEQRPRMEGRQMFMILTSTTVVKK